MRALTLFALLSFFSFFPLSAFSEDPPAPAATPAAAEAAPASPADREPTKEEQAAMIKKFEDSLQWKTGEIALHDGIVKLNIPADFKYLDHKNAVRVLQAWGNTNVGETQGMLFPAALSPLNEQAWGVLITYDGDGHIADDDAKKIDYSKLLSEMQAAVKANSEARKEHNEPTVELVGWATAPKYDEATHKMYWAKELRFEGGKENTLNYNIRVLGREGVLNLNAVATMKQLPLIEKETPKILSFVEFTDGNRYADYKAGTHKLADYGITGLVAGGLAVGAAGKMGLFKVALAGLLAAKKFVVIGAIAVISGLRAFFRRRKVGEGATTPTTLG